MKELSLHILDIAENSIGAKATRITISVLEDLVNDRLRISILDNGRGISEEMLPKVLDPFITSRTTRKVGLGIPLLKAASEMCDGFLTLQSQLGIGTTLTVEFKRSHIDRMPMGDLTGSILQLVVGYPHINWVFNYIVNDKKFVFDDALIKKELSGISLTEPVVLAFIRQEIESGYRELQPITEYSFLKKEDQQCQPLTV